MSIVAASSLAAFGLAAAGMSPAAAAGEPVDIDIVTINDFHGRFANDPGSAAAGAAVLATAVKGVRAENPNTIFAAAGDLIGASTFESFIQQDTPTIDALNAAGLEVSSVGNHEFDHGWADLRDRVVPLANWQYLAANVFLKGTDETALAPSWVKEVGGIRVGFIGAVTEELPSLVSPAGIADLEVRNIVSSVNTVADRLSDGNDANGEADVLVLLVHEGAATTEIQSAEDPTTPLGKIVAGVDANVDAIVSAHTHLAYNHVIGGRLVVSAGQYGERYGRLTFHVDPDTKQIVSSSYVNTALKVDNATPAYAPDPAVQAIVDAGLAAAVEPGARQLGSITADFKRAVQPGTTTENRGGESTLGNLVADAQLRSAQELDPAVEIAFMNPGGLRADLLTGADGVVTYKAAALVQPFANTLVVKDYTRAEIISALEQQWQPAAAARPFLKLGVSDGLSYTYDPNAPAGAHITDVRLNGEPLSDGLHRVVVNSFLASGGDNFLALGGGVNGRDSGKIDLESMVDWFAAQPGAVSPDTAQRSVGAVLSAPDADGYDAGDSVTLTLSSLLFAEEAADTATSRTVTASIGGTEVGSAPIAAGGLVNFDEYGTATLTFPLPAGVSGAQLIELAVPSTGTTAVVPITIDAASDPGTPGEPEGPDTPGEPGDGEPGTGGTPSVSVNVGSVAAGGSIHISGAGVPAGTTVSVELHSDPVVLGSATADANGAFALDATVPASTPAGAHTVVVLVDGVAVASANLTVTAAAASGLASTGVAGLGAGIGAGVVLLAVGAALLVLRRRRSLAAEVEPID